MERLKIEQLGGTDLLQTWRILSNATFGTFHVQKYCTKDTRNDLTKVFTIIMSSYIIPTKWPARVGLAR